MRTTRAALALLLLIVPLAGTAFSWGNAPTHPAVAAEIVRDDLSAGILPPEAADSQRFVRSSSCPDVAETALFRSGGFGYVHTPEFAAVLRDVALSSTWRSRAGAVETAYAWGAHIAADERAHAFVPPAQPLHTLAEVAVDTVICYDPANYRPGDPNNLLLLIGFARWEDTVPRATDCAPDLVAAASQRYRLKVDPSARPVAAWQVWWATQSLAAAIRAEFDYIRAKGGDDESKAFLRGIGLWPFTDPYRESVQAAEDWIRNR